MNIIPVIKIVATMEVIRILVLGIVMFVVIFSWLNCFIVIPIYPSRVKTLYNLLIYLILE